MSAQPMISAAENVDYSKMLEDMDKDDTQRLLGRLMAKLDSVEDFSKRVSQELSEHRRAIVADVKEVQAHRDRQIDALKSEVDEIRGYIIEQKGGKKMLAALLAAAAAIGGVLIQLIERVMK
jgi:uncharacterized protein YlaN (UPF0358 family)